MAEAATLYSARAESDMIGACLLSGSARDVLVRDLVAEDFHQVDHRRWAEAVADLHALGGPVDATVVAGWVADRYGVDGKQHYLALVGVMAECPSSGSAPAYAARIRDRSARRRLLAVLADGRKQVEDLSTPAADVADAIRSGLSSLDVALGEDVPPRTLAEFLAETESYRWLIPRTLERTDRLIVTSGEGSGKALWVETPILTTAGWATMGTVAVGDRVYGPDGNPTAVVAATEVVTGRPCYRVGFSDGSAIVADAEHEWVVETWVDEPFRWRVRQTTAQMAVALSVATPAIHAISVSNLGATLSTGPYRYVESVAPVDSVPVRCIQVARPDGMYLAGRELIATHNSTLLRQLAVQVAAGVHPWSTTLRYPPGRALLIDLECSESQARREIRPMYDRLAGIRHLRLGESVDTRFDPSRVVIASRPAGIDLMSRADRRWFTAQVTAARPDIILTGPIYKMISGDPTDERQAKALADYLDEIRVRFDTAIVLEAHSPHGTDSRGTRTLRPYGASLWLRWPEFGFGLRMAKDGSGWDWVRWRGPRDRHRWWPDQVRYGQRWPWEPAQYFDEEEAF